MTEGTHFDPLSLRNVLVNFFGGSGAFQGYGVAVMRSTYDWPLSAKLINEYAIDEARSKYGQTVELKRKMSAKWQEAVRQIDSVGTTPLKHLAKQVVADWGGIHGNDERTLDRYCIESIEQDDDAPFAGIASRSKILAIADPAKFAIMDARVVIAITVIQLICEPVDGLLFPYLQSRNRALGRPRGFLGEKRYQRADIHKHHPTWCRVSRKEAYTRYLELLRSVLILLDSRYELHDLEMTLFSQAVRLVKLLESGSVASSSTCLARHPRHAGTFPAHHRMRTCDRGLK